MAPSKNTERDVREARDRLRRYNARQAVHEHQVKRRRRDNIGAILGLIVVAALATAAQVFYFTAGPGKPTAAPSAAPSATSPSATATPAPQANVGNIPAPSTAQNRDWTGTLTLNDVAVGITLDGARAPQAVASFVSDTKAGYFIDKTCHRLVLTTDSGLIQCGSVDGKGSSDPSYSFGPIENAPANGIYPAGTIALARQGGNAYSQGHQFFIVLKSIQLPADAAGGYTVFGKVTSGLDQIVAKIAAGGIAPGGASTSDGPPATATKITGLTIK